MSQVDINIELEGTEELRKNLSRIDKSLRGEVARQAVHAGALQIENKAKINAPVMTSALRNSAQTTSKATGDGAEATIAFRREYARIQEFGGTITARNKPYLVFQYKGKWVRKKSVTIKGKHYLENAIESEKGRAVEAMADVIDRHMK